MNQLKKNNLITATIIVSMIAILGKFLGFAREAIIAAYYGANALTDAFFFAQGMPGMIFPAVCSSLSTAFISMYVSKTCQEGKIKGDRFASRALIASLSIAILLSFIALVILPIIVPILAPGFKGTTLSLAIHLSRLVMGSFVLIMAHYFLTAALNSKKFFYGAQIAGLMCNTFIIAVTVFLGKGQGVDILTLTVVGGHMVQVIILTLFCRNRISFTLTANPLHKDVKAMLTLAMPILLGNSVVQLNSIVDKALASKLTEGAISALSYSNTLNSLVTSIFITSLSTVVYPTLTENASSGDMRFFGENMTQSVSMLIISLLPVSIITMVCAKDIVSIVFERGSFDRSATELTATALFFYAIMYVFTAIREILIRGFYALKDTKTPMINGSIAVGINIIFSILLVKYMGIAGIAIGTSISSIISAILLLLSVLRRIPEINIKRLAKSIRKISLSGGFTAIVLVLFNKEIESLVPILRFSLTTILGFGIYIGLLLLLKCNEAIVGVSLIKSKINAIIKK